MTDPDRLRELELLSALEGLLEDLRGDPYAHTAEKVIVTATDDRGELVL